MKDFFKNILSSCFGVILAFVVIFLLFALIGTIAGAMSGEENDGVLKLDFSTPVTELSGNVEPQFGGQPTSDLGLDKITWMLSEAAEDKDIKGVLLMGASSGNAPATNTTLKEALLKFKESGKFIYAYADFYAQGGYYLSSVADSIFINPRGGVDVKGYSLMYPFFKGALDKLGAGFTVSYAGDFKSATEPFRRVNMSDQSKMQSREYLDELYSMLQADLEEHRGISADQLDEIINESKGRNAELSLSSRLVDAIAYRSEVEDLIREKISKKKGKKIKYLSLDSYAKDFEFKTKGSGRDKIAVVYAEGSVEYANGGKGNINDRKYPAIFEKLAHNDKVKAVVLRVNSGGGSALTSDIIWHAIEEFKTTGKPVVASFGDYAASGGYYIAAGADTIVSQPNTLTGSIGVFSMLPNVKKLMNDKIGITFDTVKTHETSVSYTPFYDVSPKEMALLDEGTNQVYDRFLEVVSLGRGMTVDQVHEVAQGRVWTGLKAKELGLVDEIGSIEDAIKIAAEMAGIDEYKQAVYPKIEKSFADKILSDIQKDMAHHEIVPNLVDSKLAAKMAIQAKYLKEIAACEGVQARLPFVLVTE